MDQFEQSRFVILDRDGTLIALHHYLTDPEQVELLPGVLEGLRRLRSAGLGLIVITNQSAIGRGYLDEPRLLQIHQRLNELLAEGGIDLDGIYYCPHLPDDACECRKPNSRLLNMAATALHFDPSQSFVIGDNISDIELGRKVGATTFLVRTGYGAQVEKEGTANPDYVVEDLNSASRKIEVLVSNRSQRARLVS